MPSGLFMGLSSTLIYTSELILCSTTKINKFATGMKNKATSDSKLNDSPVKNVNCAVPEKVSILGPQKGLEFPGGGGFCKAKKRKEMYEA